MKGFRSVRVDNSEHTVVNIVERWRPHSLQKVGSVCDIDVGMVVNIKIAVCCVMLCSMEVSYQRFGGTC